MAPVAHIPARSSGRAPLRGRSSHSARRSFQENRVGIDRSLRDRWRELCLLPPLPGFTPQRRSISKKLMPLVSQYSRTWGKTSRLRSSRSRCMSWKVDDTKIRTHSAPECGEWATWTLEVVTLPTSRPPPNTRPRMPKIDITSLFASNCFGSASIFRRPCRRLRRLRRRCPLSRNCPECLRRPDQVKPIFKRKSSVSREA